MNSTPSRRDVLRGASAAGVGVLLLGSGTAVADADRHIVGTATTGATAEARRRADSVHRVLDFGDIGSAVAGRFSETALENLAKNPNVRYIEADGTMHAIGQTLPWGVDRVDAEKVHADGETGGDNTDGDGGADIAIIDTGIDSDHPDLQPNLGTGYAVVSSRGPYAEKWDDDDGHGTHCAGITDAVDNSEGVVGVSTAATLHAVKVLDNGGSGSFSDVAEGIRWVADQEYDVGSMSLGASSGSQTVKDACTYAYSKGVLLVAAAGNSGPCTDCVGYPAAYSEVVAVSAIDEHDELAGYSSTGPEVDLAAPGTDIYSTYAGGGYDTLSGTSMACPHVSGAGGQLMDNGYTNTEARNRLTSTAEDIGLSSSEQGSGLLDVDAAVGSSSGTNSAPVVDSLSASEVETSDGDAEFDASWDVSDSDGNLSTIDLTLTDTTDSETEDTATVSVSGSSASGTTRLVAPGDDGSGNSYTVDITVTDGSGASAADSTTVTETESTNSAPSVRIDALNNNSNPRWDRYEVDWSASDSDDNLDTVVVELLDSSGNPLDSVTTDVSGSSASGVDEVRSKQPGAQVVVTAADTDGASDSDSRNI